MTLALYSDNYWYPDGTFAVGVRYDVFPRLSNVHAPLFQDALGTIPLPNPGLSGAGGLITFYVDNGDYWIHISGVTFEITVDLDADAVNVWPFTFRHVQAAPAAVWSITHGLNTFPNVDVVDTANAELLGQVDYVDANSLTITFSSPQTGIAFLRR